MKKESQFQSDLIKNLHQMFPDCIVLKNDPNYLQGFPDLTILFPNGRWAVLECKRSLAAATRPNQVFYIRKLNDMGYASFVCPENVEEVLHDLFESFHS